MADIQIHELAAITRLPASSDVLAIDTGSVTWKVTMANLMGATMKTSTVTATTDSNGNIDLGISFTGNYVLAVRINGSIATPWASGSDGRWHCRVTGITGAAITSTSVTAYVLSYATL